MMTDPLEGHLKAARAAERAAKRAEERYKTALQTLEESLRSAVNAGASVAELSEATGLSDATVRARGKIARAPSPYRRRGIASKLGGTPDGHFAAEVAALPADLVLSVYERVDRHLRAGLVGLTKAQRVALMGQLVGGETVLDLFLARDGDPLEAFMADDERLSAAIKAAKAKVDANQAEGRREGGESGYATVRSRRYPKDRQGRRHS
jgi:hypothetical protein